jgi:hypothetical protein
MATIERLVGVYDADGTLRGELTYFAGARLGRAHCALCDITHGLVRERSDWQACRAGLAVPVLTVHRDEVPATVAALDLAPPYVVAETDEGVVLLLDGAALEACRADPEALVAAIEAGVGAHGILWPVTDPLDA